MTECVICFEDIVPDESYSLICTHTYHRYCIQKWLSEKSDCPICRTPVDPDPIYVEDGIMTEERREMLETTKNIIRGIVDITECFFPSIHNWRESNLENFLGNRDVENILGEFINKYGGV